MIKFSAKLCIQKTKHMYYMWACAKLNSMEISRSDHSWPRAHLAHYATGKIGVDFPDELWFSGSRLGKKAESNKSGRVPQTQSFDRTQFRNERMDFSIGSLKLSTGSKKIGVVVWMKIIFALIGCFDTRNSSRTLMCRDRIKNSVN